MDEALIKRVMPHSIEAEQSVVGAMLMDKDAITTASEIVQAPIFISMPYGVMFESMVELFQRRKAGGSGDAPGPPEGEGCSPEIASLDFVKDLMTAVPTSANVKYYARLCVRRQ